MIQSRHFTLTRFEDRGSINGVFAVAVRLSPLLELLIED